jgi:hypothetical protein
MIDTASEDLIPVRQVPDEIPSRRPGKRINISTIWRWSMRGVRGVKLETVRIGGGTYASREAIQRFVERLSQPQGAGEASPPAGPRTAAQRRRDDARAGKELDAHGVPC